MAEPSEPRDTLIDLSGRYLDGVADHMDVERLASLLRDDPAAGRLMARLVQQHATLRWIHSSRAAARAAEGVPARLRAWQRPALVAAAACVIVAVGVGFWWTSRSSDPVIARIDSASPGGTVERNGEMSPLSPGMAIYGGDVLSAERLGAARFRYADEATTIDLRGGTRLRLRTVETAKRLELEQGTIDAEVAPQPPGRPMVVVSPHVEIDVVGTRFTVMAAPGHTRVEVGSGAVRLTRKSDGRGIGLPAGHYATSGIGFDLAATPVTGQPRSLLKNGDFEAGSLSDWNDRDQILSAGASVGEAFKFSGRYGAFLGPKQGIGQTFPTSPGQIYYISFRVRIEREIRRPGWGGIRVALYPEAQGIDRYKEIAAAPFVTPAPKLAASPDCAVVQPGTWKKFRMAFVATTPATTLRCSNFTDGALEAWVDDFVVSPEPIPD